ncbi:NADP-dependent oxidoreductase [Streptomyces anthocyanicus]|uniref:NADP-dependent oxidoreductase n=2 Tax=Streptomyces violaceoruber group TaxID=2867121 RepID=A0ABT4P4W5_9ACTN|nr:MULTISPECIES: NADP-dependent oxidoreductase [Streptomyces]MBQ0947291.1 NADP-dependent oxidoreductase [Streptomyces sp. RK76]MCW8116332.1 NADP-dependent oxidoreductase [Streptomyces anthocyanicus]MCZ4636165.1 NADP-dependent oxidoreductase [Streptomyces rubrogriseus]MDX3406888.1 NADP-dependent oxidoreductase [Streptomyces sp. ME02-6977A]THA92978.1 NADP-dependent oxidoreductase [Streptomyces sp. LRa12]
MNTMRAIGQDVLGGPEVLKEVRPERPDPRPNEVLVRVRAAGVNPTDWKHRATGGFLGEPPFVLGWDVSGVVESVGIGVAAFRPGDEVFGMLSYPFGHGSHAEYVTAPARTFTRKPSGIDHVQAGALPLVSLTAWQALVERAEVQPGQRVLVHAAAGGVGHVAVQIAKARGARVIGTASAAKHEFLRSLGADETVDYRETDFAEAVKDVDVVLDTIGGDTSLRSLRVLRPGGVVVSILPVGSDDFYEEADRLGVRAVRMLVDADRAGMEEIARLVGAGRLRATIAQTFPLAEAARAHALGETGRTTGKLVLEVD